MDIQWDDLRVFLAVARTESLSGAGRQLRLDPATVGRRMQRLETAVGAPLFAKSPQGYALTVDGQRLLDHAERAEQAVTGAAEEVGGQAGQLTGQVRIGAPDGCANYLLPQICTRLSEANPGLEIQVLALPRVVNLSKREADMAITVSAPVSGRLTVQKITDYHLHLAAHRSYLRGGPPIRTLDDLTQHPIIGYIPDMIYDKELDYLSEAGIEQVTLGSNSVMVQLHMIRQKGGIGIVHDFALPFAPGMRKVLADSFSLTRSFYLIRHPDDRRVERLNRVAEAVATELRAEVARLEAEAAA
ncbi:LysR family transcriptional regulator [Psychromarinibacter sp. C21-152]|uniref:LysR family transcriptional regulator n=1 Tax=Psychromarinibacter sediminicola TaxID=3033385 RepID=A0AAE3NTN7_9RHOB|nr:LysR family transcriptional regulator [Psychromarinibacter sediminicola]MDF0601454.1 LysR family transcriptional regulator [Psychromarinibacter sediminicola]